MTGGGTSRWAASCVSARTPQNALTAIVDLRDRSGCCSRWRPALIAVRRRRARGCGARRRRRRSSSPRFVVGAAPLLWQAAQLDRPRRVRDAGVRLAQRAARRRSGRAAARAPAASAARARSARARMTRRPAGPRRGDRLDRHRAARCCCRHAAARGGRHEELRIWRDRRRSAFCVWALGPVPDRRRIRHRPQAAGDPRCDSCRLSRTRGCRAARWSASSWRWRCWSASSSRRDARRLAQRPAVQWLLIALVAFEYWDAPIPLTPLDRPPVYQALAAAPPGAVCEVPFGIGDGLSVGVGSQDRRVAVTTPRCTSIRWSAATSGACRVARDRYSGCRSRDRCSGWRWACRTSIGRRGHPVPLLVVNRAASSAALRVTLRDCPLDRIASGRGARLSTVRSMPGSVRTRFRLGPAR